MADKPTHTDRPVSVEDLLQLKRHERPDAAFWERFDRELHEKTLRTLVKQKPNPFRFLAFLGRWQAALPLAGAAAFALSLTIGSDFFSMPGASAPVVLAQAPVQSLAPVVLSSSTSTPDFQPSGATSFVVSALPSQEDVASTGRYTQVPASRALTPAHRPEVQFVAGAIATSIPHSGYAVGIY